MSLPENRRRGTADSEIDTSPKDFTIKREQGSGHWPEGEEGLSFFFFLKMAGSSSHEDTGLSM